MTLKKVLFAGIIWAIIYQLSIISSTIFNLGVFNDFRYIVEALAMIYFLRINNEGKRYFIPISASIFILYLLRFLDYEYNFLWIPSLISFIFYLLRFSHKEQKGFLDYSKFGVFILFLAPYVLTSGPFQVFKYDQRNHEIYFLDYASAIIYVVMFFIYFIESILILNKNEIANNQKMKKILVPILIIQSVLSIVFLIFSVVQKIEADKSRHRAEQAEKLAWYNSREAQRQQKLAEEERRILKEKLKIMGDSILILKKKINFNDTTNKIPLR